MGQPLCRGALENKFGQLGSNCGEQLCGFAAALTDSYFEERQLWGVALESNFEKPLSETTFGGRLATLGRSFREPLCRMALGRHFGNRFAESQLWGNNFGEQLWAQLWEHRRGTALGSSFEEQLCTAILKNLSFGEHLWSLWEVALKATLGSNFRQQLWEQLSAAALENNFGQNFGEQLWREILGTTLGAAQRRGTTLWSNFREEV